jgi:hypothetical protein
MNKQTSAIISSLVICLGLSILLSVYNLRTWPATVWQDGFFILKYVNQIYDGNWSAAILFPRFGEHLLPVWLLIVWSNAKLLALDMRVDAFVSLFSYLLIYLLLIYQFRKDNPAASKIAIWSSVFCIGLLSFSLVQPPMVLMSSQFSISSAIGLWIAILYHNLNNNTKSSGDHLSASFFLLLGVYYCTSGGYFPGLLAGLVGMSAIYVISRHHFTKYQLCYLVAPLIFACIYFLTLKLIQQGSVEVISSATIFKNLFNLKETSLWILTGIGCSALDIHTASEQLNPQLIPAIGGVILVSLIALFYATTKKSTPAPHPVLVYCLLYPIGIILAVRVARGHFGSHLWIANEWYAFHMKFFAFGLFWLTWLVIRSWKDHSLPIKITATLSLLIFITSASFSNISQWKRSPHVYAWMLPKQSAVLEAPSDKRAETLLWNREAVDQGIFFLEKNQLAQFSSLSKSQLLGSSGWYGDKWISKSSSIKIYLAKADTLQLTAWCPAFLKGNIMTIKIMGPSPKEFTLPINPEQSVSQTIQLTAGQHTIEIQCTKGIVPAFANMNNDLRELSLVLNLKFDQQKFDF